ncbi:formylglycine-generating enzyme family protein [Alphaproteobacteria bacterium]|nr:formylglycine-generating enzyme family protein [Alphaproteobacteria bacterium]
MIERLSIVNFCKEKKPIRGFSLIIIFILLCFFSINKVSSENKGLINKVKKQEEINSFKDCPTCPAMVVIKVDYNSNRNFGKMKSYALSMYEITWENWLSCVSMDICKNIPSDHGWGKGNLPIINITWLQANNYIRYLNNITGHVYRLPSETEWEYAAFAGTKTKFWWGNEVGIANANCRKCGTKWDGKGSAPVGSFKPNPFGLYDMNGNVWEWTADCFDRKKTSNLNLENRKPTGKCSRRVIKSGSWYYIPKLMTPSARDSYPEKLFSYNIGIRVLREID